MSVRKSVFILTLLTIASHCALSRATATTSVPEVLFSDNFSESNTSDAGIISGPGSTAESRFGGRLASSVDYMFTSQGSPLRLDDGLFFNDELRIDGGRLDFSAGNVDGSDWHYDGTDALVERGIRFKGGSGDFNWATDLGEHYVIEFRWAAPYSRTFAFSITDQPIEGNDEAGKYAAYDFGIYAHGNRWHFGGDKGTVPDGGPVDRFKDSSGAFGLHTGNAGEVYDVSVTINEVVEKATIKVTRDDGHVELDDVEFDVDFESGERYFQFYANDQYGGYLDNLKITTYTVPELSNCALLTALLLLTGLFVTRRNSHL